MKHGFKSLIITLLKVSCCDCQIWVLTHSLWPTSLPLPCSTLNQPTHVQLSHPSSVDSKYTFVWDNKSLTLQNNKVSLMAKGICVPTVFYYPVQPFHLIFNPDGEAGSWKSQTIECVSWLQVIRNHTSFILGTSRNDQQMCLALPKL